MNIQAIRPLLQSETAVTGDVCGEIDFIGSQACIAVSGDGLVYRDLVSGKVQVAGLGHAGNLYPILIVIGLAIRNGHGANSQIIDVSKADRAGIAGDGIDIVVCTVEIMDSVVAQQYQTIGDDGPILGLVNPAATAFQNKDSTAVVIHYCQFVFDVYVASARVDDEVILDARFLDDANIAAHILAADTD